MANVGLIDRGFRFVVGAALAAAPFIPQTADIFAGWGDWKYAVAAAGAMLIATAIFRFCPAYAIFGVRTCDLRTS